MADNETARSTNLRYLAFKRLVWLLETVLLLGMLVFIAMSTYREEWFVTFTGMQIVRVLTEAINHRSLSRLLQVADPYPIVIPLT